MPALSVQHSSVNNIKPVCKKTLADGFFYMFWDKKTAVQSERLCVGIFLFFRVVTNKVSSAPLSLTSVFGMGTGGPSTSSTPTFFVVITCDFEIIAYSFQKCKHFFQKQLYNLYLSAKINREQKITPLSIFNFPFFLRHLCSMPLFRHCSYSCQKRVPREFQNTSCTGRKALRYLSD